MASVPQDFAKSSPRQRSYLFIHQNMPAQFLHLCRSLRDQGEQVVFITRNKSNTLSGVTKVIYEPKRQGDPNVHPYLKHLEEGVLHGQAVFRSIVRLKQRGFQPDIVIGHAGWGEMLFVKDALPKTPMLSYFEFFYNAVGQDVDFDPEYPSNVDSKLSLRIKNSITLLTEASSDWGLTPTQWQLNTHPTSFHPKMSVIHEGIDTDAIKPNPEAFFLTESGKLLKAGQKVVTFVARNLEPTRGFHTFMRAVPEIQRRHPDAEVLIVGSDGVSYGIKLPDGDSYKKRMLAEVSFDPDKVHFTGHLSMPDFRAVLGLSAAHIYLTYPFVLSWSMLEAMATGCLVVGSRTAPVEEVITHGINGLLVDFFDVQGLAAQVSDALARSDGHQSIRQAARQTIVARYDLKSVCLPRQLGLIGNLIAALRQ